MHLIQLFKELSLQPQSTQELRGLILDLAIRGRLTKEWREEHLDVEPAKVLLEHMRSEKARLVNEKKLKKQKVLPPITKEELPFFLPGTWAWSHLGDLGLVGSSKRVHKKDWRTNGIPFYRAREIVKLSRHAKLKNELYISRDLFSELKQTGLYPTPNDIMITGVGTIGVPYIVNSEDEFYFKDASVLIFKNIFDISPMFLHRLMLSNFWHHTIHKDSMGTTVHTFTISRANETLIPLPPLAEQKAIVQIVDQLLAEVDELEAQLQRRVQLKEDYVTAALRQLTTEAPAPAWAALQPHFKTAFDSPGSVDQLRQAILQLAVQGQLTAPWREQHPDTEPASVLLENIQAEKARLVQAKQIKKQKPLPPIDPEEVPFAVPEGWVWCRVGELTEFISSGSRGWAKYYSESGAKFVTMGNLSKNSLDLRLSNQKYVNPPQKGEGTRTRLQTWDYLISITGEVGNMGLVPENFGEAYINQHTAVVRFIEKLRNLYFGYFFLSPLAKLQFNEPQRGIKNSFRLSDIQYMLIPFPHLEEQKAIVQIVDELLAACDRLQGQVAQREVLLGNMLRASVREVMANS